jgi:ectoine hydroxylase-related dioxygenase (phytanoyl-CoA dioxygenase family)
MPFLFCDSMIHQYRSLGYVIFRQVLPASLIADLRRAALRIPELARKNGGPQAQRLQPIKKYLDEKEFKSFLDYSHLPPLVDAIQKILSPRNVLSGGVLETGGVFVEPADLPGCTDWHRDIRETHNVPDVEEFRRITIDPLWFNQINCPLYEDNCTWYVPGSYLRQFDLDGETAAAGNSPNQIVDKASYEERERRNLEYARSMPHAIRAAMDAGDFMLYHPNGWHLGNYLPDRKRMTIHDYAPTPELVDWYARWNKAKAKK